MSREYFMPKKIISGNGALDAAGTVIKKYGKKALIVTGKNVRGLGCFSALYKMLEDNGLLYTVFDGITGEPDDTMIAAGAKKYKDGKIVIFLLR